MSGYEGLRVLRGPDWSSGDEDGGEGFLGTVTQLLGNHSVRVQWDMGQESTCSAEHDGKCELRVFDTAQTGIRHPDTTCAECGEKDIHGMLWRCQDCSRCDLCSLCYSDDKHDTRHRFLRIYTPGCEGQPQTRRKTSVKVRTIGIFPGSKVVRGKDWEYGDQDGGQGSEGEVKGFDDVTSEFLRSQVSVQWPNGVTKSYRLGLHGNVDLKCVDEEVGPFFYRDHLPLLDTTETLTIVVKKPTESPKTEEAPKIPTDFPFTDDSDYERPTEVAQASNAIVTSEQEQTTAQEATEAEDELSVSAGDKVAIKVGEEALKELQKDCGGCTARMIRCIGRTGEVTGVSADGPVSVRFGPAKFNYRFNPLALMKLADFAVNDIVRVRSNLELAKRLNARVGWKSSMDRTAGMVGRVVKVDDDGDLRVDFNGLEYIYAPSCCLPASAASGDSLRSERRRGNRVGASEIRNPADASQASENLALFRKYREAILGESSRGQGYSMRALFSVIDIGAADKVRDMCQQDPGMVEREYQGITPLIYASLRGQHDVAVTLMDLGADVNRSTSNDFEKTPMSAVLEGENEELVYLLLERGADVTWRYSRGHTVAHLAAIRNKVLTIQALAKHGADLNLKDDRGNTPLHLAIEGKRDNMVETLVALPQVDIHIGNRRDFNMIQLCCFDNNPQALALLLERDCSRVDELRHGHSTALHIAVTNSLVECVRLLVINGGANVNARQLPSQHTPLHVSCLKGQLQTVEALLELGAEVNLMDTDGDTPLHLAIGARVEGYENKSEKAELEVACRIQIANMLISRGAFVDAPNHAGRSPFVFGHSQVKNGITNFMRHNKDIVQMKKSEETDSCIASIGTSSTTENGRGQLREALKGVGLPCGVCGNSKSDVTLQPCQHKCVCTTCSVSVSKCPLCDEKVEAKIATGEDGPTVDPENCKQL
ncbi:E3 ubiquitin-protein ligase MIB2-like isoform X1 [Littorina saxatilis]|uniref:RING-type E3 ubiquitin transferase n=1 Tax=Littorina saxatilis TaxID=31220 RepID=A0AAN9AV21_9CAEN